MRKYSMNVMVKSLFVAIAMVAMTALAGEEVLDGDKVGLNPFGCEVSVNGEVLYMRNGTLGNWATQLHIAGQRSYLTVAGTKNDVERVRVHKLENGETIVTMLFKNPPAVGGDGSVLFVGNVMDDGKKRVYFGKIYESRRSHAHVCEHDEWFVPHHHELWVHKGGFKFTSTR